MLQLPSFSQRLVLLGHEIYIPKSLYFQITQRKCHNISWKSQNILTRVRMLGLNVII